ncbi:PHB depolymerase family esterase [Segetibacter sp.]|jgi:polyhydroxybutyrate depolymerase|uniref:alpha/beta hydrolase family esterase n=1 Tax=Segetibacter sp. TaxID=2231182 RepID=UPI002619E297|nr:PHB depolymerase family esterase [Segetibacter sp.]MCW3081186.1 poly(3-hydroxybutyrate) depolymerase-like protein [Segetibacter sp.]
MFKLVLLVSLLAPTFVNGQVIRDSILIEGHYRTFNFNNPGDGERSNLVFVMHGSGGNGKDMMNSTTGLEAKAAAEKLLLVYPDGYQRYWNECRKAATSTANIENINENAFFEGMIDYFESKYRIDSKKVFAVGTSGGGHMAFKLALTMPDRIRAVTAIIANLPDTNNFDCIEVKRPISVMIINGTEDPLNNYNGGMMVLGNVTLGHVRSTDRTFSYWSSLAGYKGQPVKESLPDTDPSDGRTIERYTFKKKGRPEVVLLKVIGGKHDYPKDIDVHEEAWQFFKRQL